MHLTHALLFSLILLLSTVVACGGEQETRPSSSSDSEDADMGAITMTCEPGRVVECPCLGGERGIQDCASDGSHWSMCVCPELPTPDMTPPPEPDPSSPDMMTSPDEHEEEEEEEEEEEHEGDEACVILPAPDPATATGKQLYENYCATCHGNPNTGAALGPAILEEFAEESDDELREVIQEGEDDMPPIPLSDEEANAIIAYLLGVAIEEGYRLDERCESD